MTQLVGRLDDGQYMAFGLSGDIQRTRYDMVRYGTVCSSMVRCGAVWHSVLRLFESNEEINFDSVWSVGVYFECVQLVGKVT